jgi:hypothetical protein
MPSLGDDYVARRSADEVVGAVRADDRRSASETCWRGGCGRRPENVKGRDYSDGSETDSRCGSSHGFLFGTLR